MAVYSIVLLFLDIFIMKSCCNPKETKSTLTYYLWHREYFFLITCKIHCQYSTLMCIYNKLMFLFVCYIVLCTLF